MQRPTGFDPCGTIFGAVRYFYSAPCKAYADDEGRPNTIRWFEAPPGAQHYEDWHCFMPGIDRSGDPLTGLYEYTKKRTRSRSYGSGKDYSGVTGDHVHGTREDFLGLTLREKYGDNPPDPCGATPFIPGRFRLLLELLLTPLAITLPSGIRIGGTTSIASIPVVSSGFVLGASSVAAPGESRGGVTVGGATPAALPARVEAFIGVGGALVGSFPEVHGGIALGFTPFYDRAGLVIGGAVIRPGVGTFTSGILFAGVQLTPGLVGASGQFAFRGELAYERLYIGVGGNAPRAPAGETAGGVEFFTDTAVQVNASGSGITLRGELAYERLYIGVGGGLVYETATVSGRVAVAGLVLPPISVVQSGFVFDNRLEYMRGQFLLSGVLAAPPPLFVSSAVATSGALLDAPTRVASGFIGLRMGLDYTRGAIVLGYFTLPDYASMSGAAWEFFTSEEADVRTLEARVSVSGGLDYDAGALSFGGSVEEVYPPVDVVASGISIRGRALVGGGGPGIGGPSCEEAELLVPGVEYETYFPSDGLVFFYLPLATGEGYILDFDLDAFGAVSVYGGDCSASELEASGYGSGSVEVPGESHEGGFIIVWVSAAVVTPATMRWSISLT